MRFSGFTDEWSEHKFENIFDIKNGLNKGKDYFGEGIQILNYMDVNKYELNTENTIKDLVELGDDEIERYSVKPNDLFFTRTSETSEEIGLTSAYMGNTIKCVFSGFLLRARPKIDLNSLFFAYYLRSPRQRNNIIKFSSITTRALISGGNLSKMKIKYPDIEEQNKIANLFLILDKKVELLESKYQQYQEFKKYLMQQIFTQKLRFNFTDDWKQYKLKDVLTVKSSSISINQLEENTGDYPLYGASGFLKNIDFCEMDVDYISIVKDGSGVGNLSFHEKNSSIVNTSQYLLPKKNFNINFLYYLLQTINLMKYVNGSSIPHIYFKDYCIEKINIPSLDEQEKIGKLFVDVDITMENLNKNINATQEFKKGLLQQMFVVQLILSLLQNKKHI